MSDKKEIELIEKCIEVFMRLGIRSVTMDDLAKNLGISKKTLYKYVSDKNELVEKAIRYKTSSEEQCITQYCETSNNAIDELFDISQRVLGHLQEVHPSIFFDLEKYYPSAWQALQEHKHTYVYSCIHKNLERGKKEGLYREDLNCAIIARTYVLRIDDLKSNDYFPNNEYSYGTIYLELFRYHVRGIASDKGIAYLVEKVKNQKSNSKTNNEN